MTLAETIARLRELEAKATPGPWEESDVPSEPRIQCEARGEEIAWVFGTEKRTAENFANRALIIALRNALPELLDAAERADEAQKAAEAERDRLAARVAALEAELALQVEAARVHLKWIDKESAGPPYPVGVRRDNGGEAIWRAWWDEQLELCALSEKLCREAVSRARALLNQETT